MDAHFISFVLREGHVFEMDGRKAFPIDHGEATRATFINRVATIVKANFMAKSPNNPNFVLMALGPKQ